MNIHQLRLYFGEGLLGTLGEQHRKQRKMINPVFSPKHLQEMVPIFYNVTYKLRDAILAQVKAGPQEIDMVHWFGRTALELIGQSGIGYSFDNLDEGPPHPYSLAVKSLVPTVTRLQALLPLLPYVSELGTPAFRRALVERIPSEDVQNVRRIVDMMEEVSRDIVHSKQRNNGDASGQVGAGKDIMSILLRANREAIQEDRLTDSEVIAQVT
ncbi:hypothetical protein HWV62_27339 [Athelia sp. TMB]|nr:hypothetical protein HWV62_27339 [Athelia sp. TMB]